MRKGRSCWRGMIRNPVILMLPHPFPSSLPRPCTSWTCPLSHSAVICTFVMALTLRLSRSPALLGEALQVRGLIKWSLLLQCLPLQAHMLSIILPIPGLPLTIPTSQTLVGVCGLCWVGHPSTISDTGGWVWLV